MASRPVNDNMGVRICITVRSDPFLILDRPDAVKDECDACGAAVWRDPKQAMPEGITNEQIWCNDCAVNDLAVGPTLLQNIVPASVSYHLHGKTHVWHVDSRDDTMDRGSDSS